MATRVKTFGLGGFALKSKDQRDCRLKPPVSPLSILSTRLWARVFAASPTLEQPGFGCSGRPLVPLLLLGATPNTAATGSVQHNKWANAPIFAAGMRSTCVQMAQDLDTPSAIGRSNSFVSVPSALAALCSSLTWPYCTSMDCFFWPGLCQIESAPARPAISSR